MKSPDVEILNAAFTPMFGDGTIHYNRIPDLFDHTVRTGAKGVFLNGTTGECMSLSTQERSQLVEKWVEYRRSTQRKDFKIFVHVGSCNLFEAAQMAEHAQQLGVDGIAMVAPFYLRPTSLQALVTQCAFVASAAADTPFYYYNIPSLTGVNFPLIGFMEMVTQRIPNFAGIKNSFTDLVDYQHCIHYARDNYALYWGTDETFMMLYAAGNRHYVGSTYNYMSAVYQKMLHAYQAGDQDLVTTLQAEADSIYRVILQYNGICSGKELMKFIGVDCGPVRVPLTAFTEADSETLLRKLKETRFFHYATDHKNVIADLQ